MKKMLYNISEVASYLGVNIEDIDHEIDQGQLETITVGNKLLVTSTALQAFLSTRKIPEQRPSHQRWVYPALFIMLMAGAAMGMVFPFPDWQSQIIGPQSAFYKDVKVAGTGDPERYVPINAPLDYRRLNQAANPGGRGFSHTLISLQHQNDVASGALSFPWTFFVNLDTNHDRGDGVASNINVHNRGSGWASGYHVDSYAWGNGTTLGSNIEIRDVAGLGAYTVGMNIQNKGFPGNIGMQIQAGPFPQSHRFWKPGMDGSWQTGIKLSGKPGLAYFGTGMEFGPNTTGDRGIWLRGEFQAGIDMGNNDLRMNAGAAVQFAGDQAVALRFNDSRQRLEFMYDNHVIAFLPVGNRDVDLTK